MMGLVVVNVHTYGLVSSSKRKSGYPPNTGEKFMQVEGSKLRDICMMVGKNDNEDKDLSSPQSERMQSQGTRMCMHIYLYA